MQNEKMFWLAWEDFEHLLDERREFFVGKMGHADCSPQEWEYFTEMLSEIGNDGRSPMDIVDNFLVNRNSYRIGERYVDPDMYKDENGEWDSAKLDNLRDEDDFMAWFEVDGDIIILESC